MNKYGEVAIIVANNFEDSDNAIKDAWVKVCEKVFPNSPSSIKKSCPKDTFLGLCEEGLVKNIPQGNYTKSIKNKKYAINAVKILKENPSYSNNKNTLWKKVAGKNKTHNSQMDVVIALYKNNLLNI